MTARIAPDNQAEGISKQERAACVTKSRAGIGGSACAASIREGVRLPLVACRCRRCAALTARSGRRAGVLSRPTWVRQRVTVSPADLLSSRIVTLILGELAEYHSKPCTSVFFPMPDDVRTLLPVDHREPVAGLRSLHMHRRWRRFTQLHHVSIPSKGEAPTPRAKLPQKKSSSAAVPRSRRALH